MQEQMTVVHKVLDKIIDFLVNYSFDVFGAVVVLVAGFVLAQWVAGWLTRLCERRHFDLTLTKFGAGLVRLAILGFAVIIALGKFGITITPFIAALGGLAFGSSLAIQGPLSNYGAGLSILLTRPFKVGDTITVAGVSGVVDEVQLACTVLSTGDAEKITMPNKHIVGEVLRNSFEHHVVETVVGISYGDDPQQAMAAIRQALAGVPGVTQQPPPLVGIREFGESSLNLGVRYWVPTKQYFQTLYAVNLAVWTALERAGITLPFPQRDVRLVAGSGVSQQPA